MDFKHVGGQIYRYISGLKRCNACEIFLKVEENNCPCCGRRLRQNPRGMKYKRKLRSMREGFESVGP